LKIALAWANIPIHMVYTHLVHTNKQDRQCTYNLRSEAHLHNVYCCEQAIKIKYYIYVCVCVCVCLCITGMR